MRSRIAALFHNLPIRRKLRIIFVLTAGIALLLAGSTIVIVDSVMFYGYLKRDLVTLEQIIGDNSTAAIAFDDAKAATETLAALHARSHVQVACLYEADNKLLATYTRPGYEGMCFLPAGDHIGYRNGMLVASHQIVLLSKPVGALVLGYDLGEIVERIEIYGGTVLLSLLLSCIATVVLSARLRALIAEPILALAGIARSVSTTKDYGIRAPKQSGDEFGVLADALNQMMDGIQTRDSELQMSVKDQREALDQLAQSNADLKRSNSDLERFAFMASHDLQEPLRMITAYSELLVQEHIGQDQERSRSFMDYIVGGTKRMRELLADLLAYSAIAGLAEQPAEPVDLNFILAKVQAALNIRITESQAEIIAETLPIVVAHPSRMESLFQNLIDNAIKYRGAQPPRIHISFRNDDSLAFCVRDNGIGIKPEYYQKIFIAFQRLHGKEMPGTGVGLAICERVVERYGGRIWVESEYGAGCSFCFILPKSMLRKASK